MTATLADVDAALDQVLTSSVAYFQDLWGGRDSDDTQRAIMRAIAKGEPVGAQHAAPLQAALRKLTNRDIILPLPSQGEGWGEGHLPLSQTGEGRDGGYRFRVELVRRWVERKAT